MEELYADKLLPSGKISLWFVRVFNSAVRKNNSRDSYMLLFQIQLSNSCLKREWINSHVVEVMSFLATEVATLTCANPFICQMSCLWAVFEFSFGCATIFAFDQKWPHSRNY